MPAQRPAPSLPQRSVGKRFYTQREGPTCRSSRVSSDHHSEIGHLVVLILLSRVSLQLQGQFVPSFFEASSQDCGTWWGAAVGRHSQNCGSWWELQSVVILRTVAADGGLQSVIMSLTSPPNGGFTVDSSQDVAQSIISSPCLMTALLLFGILWLFAFVWAVLTSLIKITLWLKVFNRQKVGRGRGGWGVVRHHRVRAHFSTACAPAQKMLNIVNTSGWVHTRRKKEHLTILFQLTSYGGILRSPIEDMIEKNTFFKKKL